MISASCVVCCLLILLSLLLLVLAQGREWCRHIQVRRSQKEKVGSVSSSVPHSLLPSCSFDHENIHLHPRNHGSMDTLEILVQVVLMALYRFRIHQADLSAFRLSPWKVVGVRVGRGCSRLLRDLSDSRPHVEDSFIWTRADEEISFLQA